jgi:hypothetical protein
MLVSVQPAADALASIGALERPRRRRDPHCGARERAEDENGHAVPAFKIGGRPEQPSDSQLAEDDDRTDAEPAETD